MEKLISEDTKLLIRFVRTKTQPKLTGQFFQGQSLAVDGTIVPTVDAPEFGYTRESTDTLYCPDVFYREKDEYGNNVTKIGRPLPIEYLLTDVSVFQNMDFIWFYMTFYGFCKYFLFMTFSDGC